MPRTTAALLEYEIYGNSVLGWAAALALSLGAFLVLRLVQRVCLVHVRRLADRLHIGRVRPVLDALDRTKPSVLALLALWIGMQGMALPPKAEAAMRMVAITAFLVQAGIWASALIGSWVAAYREKQVAVNPGAVTSINAVGMLLRFAVWICTALMVMDNFGVNVTALVTGLGIGGVAVALAVQNILGDLFASLTITIDKPFVVGDFLILGEHMGTVEHIGLKNTRIRSLSGEQIVLSNSDLLNSRIRNYGRMFERRVPVVIGVPYRTPRDKLEKIPSIIRAAITAQARTRFDRAHFKAFGAYSVDFEYVYYVTSPEYNTFMDINQAIGMSLHKAFEEEGIEFAYPTQTIFIERPRAAGEEGAVTPPATG